MRELLGDSIEDFSLRFDIPCNIIQDWEQGVSEPNKYLVKLLEERVKADAINRRTFSLPKYDSSKLDLPDIRNFCSSRAWLRSVADCLEHDFVFALNDALICHQLFLGCYTEPFIYGYGDTSLTKYNGIVLLGNEIASYDVVQDGKLCFTSFNRTLTDSIANEQMLDTQGIIEALSDYYYEHNESFDGIFVPPCYQKEYEKLKHYALSYYNY